MNYLAPISLALGREITVNRWSYPLQIYELVQNFLLINQIRIMKLNVKI